MSPAAIEPPCPPGSPDPGRAATGPQPARSSWIDAVGRDDCAGGHAPSRRAGRSLWKRGSLAEALRAKEHELRNAWLGIAALCAACSDEAPLARAEEPAVVRVRAAAAAVAPQDTLDGEAMEMPRMRAPADAGNAAALASADPDERERAVLDFEGDLAELVPLATEDPSADVRRAVVQRLADGERPVERAALRRALEDADPEVLVEAALALSALDEKTAIPALERLRAHPDPEVRAVADEALDALRS